jgi:hypothetical protein
MNLFVELIEQPASRAERTIVSPQLKILRRDSYPEFTQPIVVIDLALLRLLDAVKWLRD